MRSSCLAVVLIALACAAPAGAAPRLQKVGDFNQPVHVTGAPGDHSRLYVVEKGGSARVWRAGATLPTPFLQLTDVSTSGEQGFLSIAFARDFASSRLVYAYYTDAAGDIRVDSFLAPSGDRADPATRRQVILIDHPSPTNHDGGTVAVGPDGLLWLATGDGGAGQSANAQDRNSLLGKVLRIQPLAGGGYAVPASNPFYGATPGRDEIWSYGLRNPFRFSFDRLGGDLVLADVGEGTTEEVDYAPAGSGRGRGANYGWDVCEGSFLADSTTQSCGFGTLPVIDQEHAGGWLAIVGGVVVRDPSLPSLYGRYLYGDHYQPLLHAATLGLPRASDATTSLSVPGLAGIGEDAAGCVYAASLDGPVYRVVENSSSLPCPAPSGATAPGAPGSTVPDTTPPVLYLHVPRRQRALRRRGAIAYARCPREPCTVAMRGRLVIGALSYAMRSDRKPAPRNARVRLKARLTRRERRLLKGALRRHRRARVRLFIRARDAAGNRTRLYRRSVRVRP